MKQIYLEGSRRHVLTATKRRCGSRRAGRRPRCNRREPRTDYQIITMAAAMYGKYALSGSVIGLYPAVADSFLPPST
jgi:hypothetical protein